MIDRTSLPCAVFDQDFGDRQIVDALGECFVGCQSCRTLQLAKDDTEMANND